MRKNIPPRLHFRIFRGAPLTGAILLLAVAGCPQPGPDEPLTDDDTGTSDDDDAGTPGDLCDDHPGEVVCDGETAVTCDGSGDVLATAACDTAAGEYCLPDLGCVECSPGERWCEGDTVVECPANGQGSTVVEACDAAAGMTCYGEACVTLCERAAHERGSLGCLFYAVDLENAAPYSFSAVVTNPSATLPAHVTASEKSGSSWSELDAVGVPAGGQATLALPVNNPEGSVLLEGYAVRIESTLPISAVQLNPPDLQYTADASLLAPAAAAGTNFWLPGWSDETYGWPGLLAVSATEDGTHVTVTPAAATSQGVSVPAGEAGVPMETIVLDEGDVLQLGTPTGLGLQGSGIESTKPVTVFAGHHSANVPAGVDTCCADHLEEQVPPLEAWGREAIAARFPPRQPNYTVPEPTFWQVVAGDAPATLTFHGSAELNGLPPGNALMLQAGETYTFEVTGNGPHPGDFRVEGDERFLLVQFAASALYGAGWWGDPCMVTIPPPEQFLDRYVTTVPAAWADDSLVITRSSGADVICDGLSIDTLPEARVTDVDGLWEVVRFPVEDGVHVVEGAAPFGLLVVGFDEADSYCFPAGYAGPSSD